MHHTVDPIIIIKKCKILSQLVPIKWRRPFMSHSNLASSVISREFGFIRFRPLSFENISVK